MKSLYFITIFLLISCSRQSLVNSDCRTNCYQIVKNYAKPALNEKGEIKGRLFDFADNSPFTSARISIKGINFEQELKTNEYGDFSIMLNEGHYTIKISSIGIHELTTRKILVRKGYSLKIDFMITYEV
ncbi:carboxypeptidase regulatory-like domain-containing protein [Emticicia agri]|uniref:Carboxypeptidase regulatory-like domain-containing protein n=1 Tax=Emticicia agri TaxID=2492393 RepID=A0A4Q5LX60_9BACT|nr:carboxypeptidase regulatory-like domain-containing protein [Emticicia agri]RYU94426.1 hypothetical protein EWM59_16640 [Emticicia agri]